MEIRENIERHLNVLCKEIGARPTGSEANHTAVEYACREFERAGLDVLRQEFDCMDWVDNGGILTVGGKAIPMAAAPYSLPCSVQGRSCGARLSPGKSFCFAVSWRRNR